MSTSARTLTVFLPPRPRWVTTSIARFDPDAAWSDGLACNVSVNPALRAWDSTLINLPDPKLSSHQVTTPQKHTKTQNTHTHTYQSPSSLSILFNTITVTVTVSPPV